MQASHHTVETMVEESDNTAARTSKVKGIILNEIVSDGFFGHLSNARSIFAEMSMNCGVTEEVERKMRHSELYM